MAANYSASLVSSGYLAGGVYHVDVFMLVVVVGDKDRSQ